MSRNPTLTQGAAALALGFAVLTTTPFTTPALADDSHFEGVMNMDVWTSTPAAQVVVRNIAGNHHIDSLNLAVQDNSIAVGVSGLVDCTGTQFENWAQRYGYFLSSGAFGIGRTSLLLSEALPNSSDIDHNSALGHHGFQLPIAQLANPQIGLDPTALVLAAAEQSPDKLAWLRQDHILTVKIPLRWEADCASYTRNKITKKTIVEAATTSYLTKDVDLKIKYEGDPQLFALNAQIGQGGVPKGFLAGPQPLKITSAQFQPNMPHHVGACPATTKIRVFYQGHGKGAVQITIADGNNIIANSGTKAFDGTDGQQVFDFNVQVPQATPSQLNKTVNHTLKASVRTRDSGPSWDTPYKTMATVVWKHRCTPQVNPALGGTVGGGSIGGVKQGKPNPTVPVIKRAQ
jgi:hypothetical protein